MKPKQAFILLAAVAALVAVIVVYEYVVVPGRAQKQDQAGLFFPDLDPAAVNNITVAGGDTATPAVTLVRGGDSVWKVESKGGYPADGKAVSDLLDALKGLKRGTMSSESVKSHERLGVDEAHGKRLTVKNGASVAADLIVGSQGKSFGTYFARLAGEDAVYLVLEDLKNLIDGNAGEWRDKKIFDEDLAKIAEITLTVYAGSTAAPGGTAEPAPSAQAPEITVLKLDPTAQTWTLVNEGGTAETIDKSKADGLARSLATMSAVEFADTAAPASAGLEPPARKAELKMSDGKAYTLLVGREDQSKFFVKRADRGVIQKVYRYNVENIFKSRAELLAPAEAPVDFDPSNMLPPPNLPDAGGTYPPDEIPDRFIHEMIVPEPGEPPAPEPVPEPVPEPAPDMAPPADTGESLATPPSLHTPPPGAPPPEPPDNTP